MAAAEIDRYDLVSLGPDAAGWRAVANGTTIPVIAGESFAGPSAVNRMAVSSRISAPSWPGWSRIPIPAARPAVSCARPGCSGWMVI